MKNLKIFTIKIKNFLISVFWRDWVGDKVLVFPSAAVFFTKNTWFTHFLIPGFSQKWKWIPVLMQAGQDARMKTQWEWQLSMWWLDFFFSTWCCSNKTPCSRNAWCSLLEPRSQDLTKNKVNQENWCPLARETRWLATVKKREKMSNFIPKGIRCYTKWAWLSRGCPDFTPTPHQTQRIDSLLPKHLGKTRWFLSNQHTTMFFLFVSSKKASLLFELLKFAVLKGKTQSSFLEKGYGRSGRFLLCWMLFLVSRCTINCKRPTKKHNQSVFSVQFDFRLQALAECVCFSGLKFWGCFLKKDSGVYQVKLWERSVQLSVSGSE